MNIFNLKLFGPAYLCTFIAYLMYIWVNETNSPAAAFAFFLSGMLAAGVWLFTVAAILATSKGGNNAE